MQIPFLRLFVQDKKVMCLDCQQTVEACTCPKVGGMVRAVIPANVQITRTPKLEGQDQ